jgi:hypothetical protein
MPTIAIASFLMGAALIFIAILGGGIEAKEVKIPVLNFWARILSFIFGCTLIGFGLVDELFPRSGAPTIDRPSIATPTQIPTPAPPSTPAITDDFGIALIASSTPQVAQENANKAKSFAPPGAKITLYDVAPSFYPATIGVWSSVMPCWAVVAAVRGAKPSVGRSAADRRAAA